MLDIQISNNFIKFRTCRGDSFRRAFSRLLEVRSIIPNGVKLMAFATISTRYSVCQILGMTEPSIVAVTPTAVTSTTL